MVVGLSSPSTTVRTSSCGCSISGGAGGSSCAAAKLTEVRLISRVRATTSIPILVKIPFLTISITPFKRWKTTQPGSHQRGMEFVKVAELSGNGVKMRIMSVAGVMYWLSPDMETDATS